MSKIRTHRNGTADSSKEGRLIRIDYSTDTKIADHNVRILSTVPEQNVFWLEVTVDDARLVKACNSVEDGPDEICGIPAMEGRLATS